MLTPAIYRYVNPYTGESDLKPPLEHQHPTLAAVFKGPTPKGIVRCVNLCCGIGFGKTTLGVDIAQAMLELRPGTNGMFLEPNTRGVQRNFWPAWRAAVPPELYSVIKSENVIEWHNGSRLWYDHRNVSGNRDDTADRLARGPNLSFVIDDETAVGFDPVLYFNLHARIRQPNSPILLYATLSTPKVGVYADLVNGELYKDYDGANLDQIHHEFITLTGRTQDNPYMSAAKVAQLRALMGRAMAARELDGQIIALEDSIWSCVDLDHAWPQGNVDEYQPRFDPQKPYYILADIGSATGAYVIVQKVLSGAAGRHPFSGGRWVIVGELCPQSDGAVRHALEKIRAHFGPNCAGFSAGADVDTRAAGDGTTPAYFVQKVFVNCNIFPCREDDWNKHVQQAHMEFMFLGSDGYRRLTIAKDLVERKASAVLDLDSKRGVIEMIKQDVWPPDDERRAGEYLPKGPKIRISHVRDALLMGNATIMRHPQWGADGPRR